MPLLFDSPDLSAVFSFCRILISHEGPVWAIERKGDFLVSGSSDKTVSECSFVLICACRYVCFAKNHQCRVKLNNFPWGNIKINGVYGMN